MELLDNFNAYIKKENLFEQKDKLLVAVSGGMDSAVLCALCAQAGFDFSIAHCNFNLRGAESKRDEDFVRALAAQYNVPLFCKAFDTLSFAAIAKMGIEETARNLRYTWFNELVHENNVDFLLTAHHADDNIETVLMNFFRGTGIKGIRGILSKQGIIVRPLLFAKRNEIAHYAHANKIEFVIDSTNAESDYTRNYFRNELIPSIEKVYPETANNILKNISRFADIEFLYNNSMAKIKANLIEEKNGEVHIAVLKLAKSKPLQTIIYEIINAYGFTAAQVGEVEKLLVSESGKYISSGTHRILRNRNWLIISPLNNNIQNEMQLLEAETSAVSFAGGNLQVRKVAKPETFDATADIAFVDASNLKYPLFLRKWKQGDYFYPLGMQKKKKLSRFFVDQKLSLTQKENVWVLESDKKIVWILGYRIDDRFKITSSSTHIVKLSLTP
jgi:tRNA(Ile)-lysidine synthase